MGFCPANTLSWIKFTNIMLRETRLKSVHNELLHLSKIQIQIINNA